MAPIQCPSCGAVADLGVIRHGADEFCSSCDFPLFWARAEEPDVDLGDDGEDVLAAAVRRRPGAGGRQTLAGEPCPACSELNSSRAVYCTRCGADMHPPPPPPEETVAPVVAAPAPVPVAVEAPPRRRWWLLGVVLLCVLLVIQLVVLLYRIW
ncbi:MAG: hypothetical protein ABR511_09510 [Acidimicrobiales bacterium]